MSTAGYRSVSEHLQLQQKKFWACFVSSLFSQGTKQSSVGDEIGYTLLLQPTSDVVEHHQHVITAATVPDKTPVLVALSSWSVLQEVKRTESPMTCCQERGKATNACKCENKDKKSHAHAGLAVLIQVAFLSHFGVRQETDCQDAQCTRQLFLSLKLVSQKKLLTVQEVSRIMNCHSKAIH